MARKTASRCNKMAVRAGRYIYIYIYMYDHITSRDDERQLGLCSLLYTYRDPYLRCLIGKNQEEGEFEWFPV